jgi:hypothetical protein
MPPDASQTITAKRSACLGAVWRTTWNPKDGKIACGAERERQVRVAACGLGAGQLEVQVRLSPRLIPGVEEPKTFGFAFGAET